MATKLYFHAASSTVGGTLPTTEQSSLTANANVDPLTTNRSMDTTIGTSQDSLVLTSNATTSQQTYYFTRFVSAPLNVTSISANTWTYFYAVKESNASANFPVNGSGPLDINLYVWRPSSGIKFGTIAQGLSTSTAEPVAGSEVAQTETFSGALIPGMQAGDVLVFEVWFVVTQSAATAYTDTFYYDGTSEATGVQTSVASYISTPQNLTFAATSIDMTNVSTTGYTNKFIIKV